MISFNNLWNVMKEKGVSQYALIKRHGVSPAQITRLKRNESVSTHTIEMFCKILDCKVEDIMEYIKPEMEIILAQSTLFCAESVSSPDGETHGFANNIATGKDTLDD